ncbi:MAG: phosphoribosylaminoimidazolesuccinocarboxamide synthase [Halobacteriaceae archaeon]
MTSVKEIRVDAPPEDGLGRGRFYFTDAYSVFDWGQMPDDVPEKGASLCTMGADNFESLEAAGVDTHYRGVVVDGAAVPLDEAETPPREMAVALARVPDLPHTGEGYDYDAFHEAAGAHYLVPLEVVFRNTVPPGSSLRRRTDPADHGLPFESWPAETVELEDPIVEFSTKFEEGDRYLTRAEAARIAGRADLDAVETVAREVNAHVTDRAQEAGFEHLDGKIEVVYDAGDLLVADVVGTFDENRFSYEGVQVSKEVVRQYYRHAQPAWVEAVSEAKATAKARGLADWKPLCDREPDPLPPDVLGAVRDLYAAGANAYTGRDWFDAPDVGAAVDAVRDL